ncbi:WecB/TagA/CpsF family glycosyltransferase [Aquihabitans sp. McL0605]|uniref:WecB/TagA/CpsF family glycosyltransferase n=1 Tax=Aquihabitans sp. McL0605 TaxID=3415671 RepID=UPI003CF6EC90
MIDRGKRSVLGVSIDAVDLDAAVERIAAAADLRRPYLVSALAVHGVIESARDRGLRASLNGFDAVLPDGQAVVWALNALYPVELPHKVPGPTVMTALLDRSAAERSSVYFYGSTPATLDRIRVELDRRYGERLEVHTRPSRFGAVDRAGLDDIAEAINASGAQLCFVGLGCPRQERFVAAVGPSLAMPSLAVGAAFDYLAGTIQRAPEVIQRFGLEWAHRMAQEPRRLAGRYVTTNSRFVVEVSRQVGRQRVLGRPAAAPVLEVPATVPELVDA